MSGTDAGEIPVTSVPANDSEILHGSGEIPTGVTVENDNTNPTQNDGWENTTHDEEWAPAPEHPNGYIPFHEQNIPPPMMGFGMPPMGQMPPPMVSMGPTHMGIPPMGPPPMNIPTSMPFMQYSMPPGP